MASSIYTNIHELSTSDMKKKIVSPDSTNNNNTNMNNNNTFVQAPPATTARRGRKSAAQFVQVIPGQPMSVARRNARERNRVKQVNNGFSTLRQHIPFTARNKKMSKVETLRCAVEYIRSLQQLLDENGGYDRGIDLDLSHNVSSSSPASSMDSEEHSLMSISTSDVMYDHREPSSSTIIVDDYTPNNDYSALRTSAAMSRIFATESDVVFDDSPLPSHPNNLIRHGSSLSPGYSDRSSVNNSPATAEVTTTGFMGVFAAAAAGLDKNPTELMMDLSRGNTMFLKKERVDMDDNNGGAMLDLEGANSNEMMEAALTWWEVEQSRRIHAST